jgi:hypothetical protein
MSILDVVFSSTTAAFALVTAWTDSNPEAPDVPRGTPGSLKQEQGGWILQDPSTSELTVQRVAAGTRDSLPTIAGTRPSNNVIAWFHTHPNKRSEGYTSGPSPGDKAFTTSQARCPGIVQSHDGNFVIPFP